MVITGNIGPRGDGYRVDAAMSADEAQDYHAPQVDVFARQRGRHGQRLHAQLCQRGDRRRARGEGRRHAGGDLVHGRDRRQAAERADAEGCDRGGRCRDRRCAGLLHDQLRASRRISTTRCEPASAGSSGCAACAPMPRCAATPSSMRRPISTSAIRSSSGGSYRDLRKRLPHLTVLGGCCGTDHRHVEQIAFACVPGRWQRWREAGVTLPARGGPPQSRRSAVLLVRTMVRSSSICCARASATILATFDSGLRPSSATLMVCGAAALSRTGRNTSEP